MPKTVRACVKTGIEQCEIREFARPEIPPESGLLRVESAGVGGSDPEMYRRPNTAPCIMGHENVGMVEEIGHAMAARWGIKPGDRIALHEYLPCWRCHWCLQGDFRLCMEADFFNLKDRFNTLRYGTCNANMPPHLWGGFAQYMYLAPNAVIHPIPETMSARHATLAIPLGNGVQWAVLDGGTKFGSKVLVFGPGQQGLGCALAAKAAGASLVILAGLGRDRARLHAGLKLGADLIIVADEEDLGAAIAKATGGRGVDVVVDTTSDPDGKIAEQAIAASAKGACLNLNGLGASVPIGDIKKRHLTIRAPRGHSYEAVQKAIDLIGSGRWDMDLFCSHDFGLQQVHEAILATAGRGIEGAVHVTVNPWK